MGKVVALLIGGAGAAAVSVGGAYLLKGKASSQQSDSATEENTKKVEFDDLSKFKKAKGGRCAIDLFKEIENIESKVASVEFTSSNPQNTEFFGTASTDANKTKGCLIINWERSENSDKSKGSGIFTWVWAFINDRKGFVTFNVIKTSDGSKMNMFGGAYLLEQEGEDAAAKWKIKYHKEVTEDSPKTITGAEEFGKYFPSVKSDGVVKEGDNAYWGFLKGSAELTSMCGGENSCGMALSPLKPFKRRWNWTVVSSSAENNKLIDLVKDFQWGDRLYTESDLNLSDRVKDFSGQGSSSAEV